MTQQAMPTAWYKLPDGSVAEVSAEHFGTAERADWKPATQADIKAAEKKEAASTTSAKVAAFGEGVAAGAFDAATAIPRAATALGAAVVGKEDPLARVSGRQFIEDVAAVGTEIGTGGKRTAEAAGRQFAEDSRARATENAGLATAGNVIGQVGATIATGGGALAARAGAGATARLGGGALARVAGAGLAGVVEGAPLSLVASQDQAYIENRKHTGGMAIAAMGVGSLIGFGVGAGMRGLGEAIGAGRRAVSNRFSAPSTGDDAVAVATKEFGEAAPGLRDAYSKASGAVSGKDTEVIRAMTAGGKAGREARKVAVFEGDSIREASKREIRQHVDDMSGATRNLTEEWRGSLKTENVGKVISRGESSAAQVAQVDGQLAAVKTKLAEMLEDGAAYGERAKLQKLGRFVETAEKEYGRALETGSNEGMFVAMDELKKKVGALASPGRMITSSADQAVAQEARVLHDSLRGALQDETVWGGAASMQREVNEPFAKWLKSKSQFEKRFTTETGELGANPWERTRGADPKGIDSFVENLTNARNDLDHQIIKRHIADTKDLAGALSKAGELTPEKAAELAKVVKAAEGFEATVAKAEKSLVLSNQLRALEKMDAGGNLAGVAGGALLGGAFSEDSRGTGAGIGAAIGAGLGALRNPGLMVRRMAMMERMAEKAGTSVDGAIGKLFAGIEGAGEKLGAAVSKAKAGATPTALELFQGKHATPELAYKERANEVLAANENYGQRIRDNAAEVFGGTFDADPHAVGAAVVATTKAVGLLAEKMPGGLVDHQSFTPMSAKTAPSRADIMEYAQLWTAVTQPLAVIADIPKGSVTRDQFDAIAAVHPALAERVKSQTLDRLQKLDERGIDVPIRERIILDTVLGLDGAAEPVFSASFAMKYQAGMTDQVAMVAEGNRPQPSQRKSQVGSRLRTKTDTMIGGS